MASRVNFDSVKNHSCYNPREAEGSILLVFPSGCARTTKKLKPRPTPREPEMQSTSLYVHTGDDDDDAKKLEGGDRDAVLHDISNWLRDNETPWETKMPLLLQLPTASYALPTIPPRSAAATTQALSSSLRATATTTTVKAKRQQRRSKRRRESNVEDHHRDSFSTVISSFGSSSSSALALSFRPTPLSTGTTITNRPPLLAPAFL